MFFRNRRKASVNGGWSESSIQYALTNALKGREQWQSATTILDEVGGLAQLLDATASAPALTLRGREVFDEAGITTDGLPDLLNAKAQQAYDELIHLAAVDRTAFESLRSLMEHMHHWHAEEWGIVHTDYQDAGAIVLPYPEQWNDWVAYWVEIPSKYDFDREALKIDHHNILLKAVQSIEERNITTAKIVAALCQESQSLRAYVGETQLIEVMRFINEYNRHSPAIARA